MVCTHFVTVYLSQVSRTDNKERTSFHEVITCTSLKIKFVVYMKFSTQILDISIERKWI
jgi:hypothetical protein